MNLPTNEISVAERLGEVYQKIDSRDYTEGLAFLELVRSSDPGNIYIVALKRQIETLLTLDRGGELGEDRRRELMEPMPGIIECAVRDHGRETKTVVMDLTQSQQRQIDVEVPPSQQEKPAPHYKPAQAGKDDDAQKELEALKLLYFQRASKFVMKGEYEQALAEVRRVFIVDPQNTIAKEYVARVEQLVGHARQLASAPAGLTDSHTAEPLPKPVRPVPEEKVHVHSERSTAWDDAFASPKSVAPVSEHEPAPPSHRQTVAYGNTFAASLKSSPEYAPVEEKKPHRRFSTRSLVLSVVCASTVFVGGVFVFLSSVGGGTSNQRSPATIGEQSVKSSLDVQAAGTLGASHPEATEQKQDLASHPPQPATAKPLKSVPPPLSEEKARAEQEPVKPEASKPEDPAETSTSVPLQQTSSSDPLPVPEGPMVESRPLETKPTVTDLPAAGSPAFVPVEREPQILKLEKPEFPSFVWKTGLEGQVVVKVLIDAAGKPIDTQILKSTNSVFEQPVIDAVMKSQFNPAQMGHGPVTAWLTIPFKFKQPR